MIMKKIISTGLAVLCAACLKADALLERFDAAPSTGKILGGATLDPAGGLELGALKAVGNGQNLQYFYNYDVSGKPGEQFAIALNYKTTPAFVNNSFLIIVTFDPVKGRKTPGSLYFRMPKSPARWSHRQFEFTMPEDAVRAHVMLRLAGVPASEAVWVDFLRVVPKVDGKAKGVDLESFETTFDGWSFDKQLIFDHFMIGSGGKIRNEWREAKVGEAFFQADGDQSPMQYALYIENIKVKPRGNYLFEAFYQATENFKFKGNGILIFFYKDAEGKAIGQSRFYFTATGGQWKELTHPFTTPEQCAFVDIGLNIRNMGPEQNIKLDHPRFKPAADRAEVRTETNSAAKTMQVHTLLTGEAASGTVAQRVFSIRNAADQLVAEQPAPPAGPFEFDLQKFPDGEYQLIAQITLADGRVFTTDPKAFSVFCKPDWSNDIGIQQPDMTPPAPWTALQPDGRYGIRNWNGQVTFAADLMLAGIFSGTTEVAGPLSIKLNEQPLAVKGLPFQVKPSLAAAAGSARIGDVDCELALTVDYMGFIHYQLTFKAVRQTELQALTLNLPVRDIEFVYRTDGSWTEVGAVELADGKTWETKRFYDNIMLGNVDRGVSFYCEKAYPAQREFARNWARVDRQQLVVNLINEPIKLDAAQRVVFEFALCAYPFRPAENNWRRLRFRGGRHNNFDLVWQTADMFKYAGSLATPANPETVRKFLARKVEYQLFYQIPTYIAEKIPAWNFFRDRWQIRPSRAYDMEQFGMLYKGDFRERSWSDLYVKTLVDVLKEYPWDGVYYDCFGTDVFTVDGESFNPVFSLRKFQERIYNAQRISNPKSLTVTHAGADQGATMIGFANAILMGEQYRAQFMTATYYSDFMSMEKFRYECAVNMGPDRMLLPQYRQNEKIESPQVATHVMGMALLHNLMIYPNFIRKDIELSIRDRLYEFGLENADFHGYWQPGPKIRTGAPDVYVSYYSNPKGCFATVLNYSQETRKCRLELPFEFKKATVFDPVSGTSAPFTGEIELAANMAKFIEFGQ